MNRDLQISDVRRMDDWDLCHAVSTLLQTAPVYIREGYEREFAENLPNVFRLYGGFTWKQRRLARELLIRFLDNRPN